MEQLCGRLYNTVCSVFWLGVPYFGCVLCILVVCFVFWLGVLYSGCVFRILVVCSVFWLCILYSDWVFCIMVVSGPKSGVCPEDGAQFQLHVPLYRTDDRMSNTGSCGVSTMTSSFSFCLCVCLCVCSLGSLLCGMRTFENRFTVYYVLY